MGRRSATRKGVVGQGKRTQKRARPRRRKGQLLLKVSGRGGWRPDAGRKRGTTKVPHRARPSHSPRHPIHVTLRAVEGVPNLRRRKAFRWIRRCIQLGHKEGFRVVQYSVMSNHFHLIIEAGDRRKLARGLQGLKVRLARRLNALFQRRGTFFSERYHARTLKTPTETRNALLYVLNNARRHGAQSGRRFTPGWVDPFSSSASFDGWSRGVTPTLDLGPETAAAPETWLLQTGWKRTGPLDPNAVPGAG